MTMRMEIKNENYNRFLKRKEIEIYLEHPEEATPSIAAVSEIVAKQTSSEPDKIEIKEIMTSRGSSESNGIVFVWDEKIPKKETKTEPKKEEAPKETTKEASKE